MTAWLDSLDPLTLLLGAALGVVLNELWRWIRPPEELVILRAMQRHFSQAQRTDRSAHAPARLDLDAAFRPMRERAARYAAGMQRARLANVCATLALAAAFGAGMLQSNALFFLLAALSVVAFGVAQYFRAVAGRAWQ